MLHISDLNLEYTKIFYNSSIKRKTTPLPPPHTQKWKNGLNRHSQNKICEWTLHILNNGQYHLSPWKFNLMRWHSTSTRKLKQKKTPLNVGEDVEQPDIFLMRVKIVKMLWKSQHFLRKWNIHLLYEPVILLLGIYLDKWDHTFTKTLYKSIHRNFFCYKN